MDQAADAATNETANAPVTPASRPDPAHPEDGGTPPPVDGSAGESAARGPHPDPAIASAACTAPARARAAHARPAAADGTDGPPAQASHSPETPHAPDAPRPGHARHRAPDPAEPADPGVTRADDPEPPDQRPADPGEAHATAETIHPAADPDTDAEADAETNTATDAGTGTASRTEEFPAELGGLGALAEGLPPAGSFLTGISFMGDDDGEPGEDGTTKAAPALDNPWAPPTDTDPAGGTDTAPADTDPAAPDSPADPADPAAPDSPADPAALADPSGERAASPADMAHDALSASPFGAGIAGAPEPGGQSADGPNVWPPLPAAPSTTGEDLMDDRTTPSPSATLDSPDSPDVSGTPSEPADTSVPAPWVPRPSEAAGDSSGVITIVIPGDATPGAGEGAGGPAVRQAPAAREVVRRRGFTLARDGSYAACLAEAEGGWFVERWTVAGAEAYAVPLPGAQPEEAGTPVAPLPDGRVLVLRRVGDRHDVVLLYPTGPGTGELPAGSVTGDELRLLPPSPVPGTAFVLAFTGGVSTVWQVLGTGDGSPSPVMTVRGRCSGGVWLDRTGRLLALDREVDGRAKAVAADLHTGEVSPLLQLTDDSDDRLVLAEPDSGLLLLRSDAAGGTRLGWGVLGSTRPVRFPDVLRVPGLQLSPVAAQPGQILTPESVVVALRAEAPGGAESLALWRPGERRVHWRAVPAGWLSGTGLWLPGTDLHLPYAAPEPGLMRYDVPPTEPEERAQRAPRARLVVDAALAVAPVELMDAGVPAVVEPRVVREPGRPKPVRRPAAVLPLQQAPLATTVGGGPA